MKKIMRIGAVLMVALFVAVSAQAADVLYFADWPNVDADTGRTSVNPFPTAMANLGLTVTTAASAADFNTKLGTGAYQTAVLLLQDTFLSADSFSSVPGFLAGGSKMLFSDVGTDPTMAAWFGIAWSGNTWGARFDPTDSIPTVDGIPSLTLTAPFAAGIGDPLLYNPGWTVTAMGITPGSGLQGGRFENGDFAVAYGANFIVNGVFADTFADSTQGMRFAENELSYLTGTAAPVPVPPSLLLLGPGLAGIALLRRRLKLTSSESRHSEVLK